MTLLAIKTPDMTAPNESKIIATTICTYIINQITMDLIDVLVPQNEGRS